MENNQAQESQNQIETKKEPKENKKVKRQENKTESLNFKCEQFFGKNWKFVASFIALALIIIAYEMSSISSRMESLERIVEDNNGKVVLTTTDGRAIKVTKEPLKAEYLKQFATSTYVNNFIVSRSQLTNNFRENTFKNYDEVFENVPSIKNILVNFIDSKADKDKEIVPNKQAIGDLRAYVQWLMSAIAQDKLPEYIAIKDYSVEKYEYNSNKFDIEIAIKIIAQSYIIVEDKYIQQDGVFKIKSQGSFDLNKSSDTNPYGMRIERLIISPVIKAGK